LDAETKQPVEGAWVKATLQIKTKTIQGNVYNYPSVDPPHTRTDKDGKFIIPAKKFRKPAFPVGFGTVVESFGVGAKTADWRGGGVEIKDQLGKGNKIEVVILIRSAEKVAEEKIMAFLKDGVTKERADQIIKQEYFSSLQALYNYCLTGRFGVEVPPVEGGCDEWELDYAIAKHESFLKRLGKPRTMDQRIHYTGTMKQLAYLYKQKGDYKKALEKFIKVREFDIKRKMDLWLKEYEFQINELQKLIGKKQK
jgi:hypothetical protein